MKKNLIIIVMAALLLSSWNTTTPKLWLCFKSKEVKHQTINHFEIVRATTKEEAEAIFDSKNYKQNFIITSEHETKGGGLNQYFVIEAEKIFHESK